MLQACVAPLNHHEPRKIIFKTPHMAYADAGFIHDNGSELKVEIFMAGHAALVLEMGRKICMDGYCFKKKDFVKKYLNSYYPEDILQQIFLGKPIFEGTNLTKLANGFSQTIIKEGTYQISYKVTHDTIRFKDGISRILIKTEKLDWKWEK